MATFNRDAALFSLNSFVAAALALSIGFAADLERPYWSVMTVYIVSQPLAGAVRSKAVYRVLGTFLGAAFSVVVVPALVNQPFVLSCVLAAWVGVCLTISQLDRRPRSYTMMLAGYSAAIVSFPIVSQPGTIFDFAVSRVEEITLGIGCAALTHSLLFPVSVRAVLRKRLASWLHDANDVALDLLRGEDKGKVLNDRRHLATAATEIHMLAQLLPYDVAEVGPLRRAVQVAHDRLLTLIPLLSAIGDRLSALTARPGGLDANTAEAIKQVTDWIEAGTDPVRGWTLARALDQGNDTPVHADWADLLRHNLVSRLVDLVTGLSDGHDLAARGGEAVLPIPGAGALVRPARLHQDAGLAALSGLSAALAMLLVCAFWILSGWPEGASAAALAGVFCSLFASLDDPAPAIIGLGVFSGVGICLAGLYQFAILPGVDGLVPLLIFLAPPFLIAGYLMGDRRRMPLGLGVAISFPNALALQDTYRADFAAFINSNLGVYVGLLAALFVTRLVRSMSLDAALGRLFRHNWKQLAALARQRRLPEPSRIAAEMVDRVGLIVQRVAVGDEGALPIKRQLAELRVATDLAQIRQHQDSLPPDKASHIELLLTRVGAYYAAQSAGQERPPETTVLAPLDRCLHDTLTGVAETAAKRTVIAALVGLRRNLFPDAPDFIAEVPL